MLHTSPHTTRRPGPTRCKLSPAGQILAPTLLQLPDAMNMMSCMQLDLNEFADLTWEEFSSTHLGLLPSRDGGFR